MPQPLHADETLIRIAIGCQTDEATEKECAKPNVDLAKLTADPKVAKFTAEKLPELLAGLGGVSGGSIATTSDIVVRAIAGVLEKRAKAEFRLFILRRLRSKICTGDPSYQDWIPNTCAYLGTDDDDDKLPLALGAGFRAALVLDAVQLPDRVLEKELSRGGADKLVTRLGVEAALVLRRERDPGYWGSLMTELGSTTDPQRFTCDPAGDLDCLRVKALLGMVGPIVTTARSKGWGEAWAINAPVIEKEIATFLKNLAATQPVIEPTKLTHERVQAIGNAALAVAIALRELTAALDAQTGEGPDAAKDKAQKVLRQTSQLLTGAIGLVRSVAEIAKDTTDLGKLVGTLETARDLTLSLADGDIARVITLLVAKIGAVAVKVPPAVTRVVSFAVDLATAKDPAEAEAVFESIAAPVGAWRGKLDGTRYSITGFVGGGFSGDRSTIDDVTVTSKSVAPFAALGVDINPWPNHYLRPGLFLSVIDVGSLMSYGFSTDKKMSTDGMTEYRALETTPIGFAQVFSPGVFARFGVWKLPLVVGAGVSFVPEARTISSRATVDSTTTTEDVAVVRFSAFLAIDVTLFPF